MECEEYKSRRVKLGYVADCPHCVQLVDSIGNQVFDMLPVIQGGETDTSLVLIPETERLRYYPEEYTRTEGQSGYFNDICISDIAALIDLGDLRNVNTEGQSNGDTIVYNSTTGMYELFNLTGALDTINTRIDNLTEIVEGQGGDISDIYNQLAEHNRKINQLFQRIAELQNSIDALAVRIKAIEDAIYNWTDDKSTKIPRANINVTSGGYTGDNGIFCRAKNQNNDLDFQ